ncbi:MAG: hypothetical protein JW717_00795 [Marinilabiliaceae bacterium]|nr:hypothetical protein [Marinilabiliaceae bacterium]
MNKRTFFKIIAVLLPIIIIAFIEISLRITGYGINYNLFNKIKTKNQSDYLVLNPAIGKKYFVNKNFNSDNQGDIFLKTKNDSTFRVFIQGASTVVGFPYYYSGSFPNMLKHRLSQTFPEKNIEIINTGISATNTYTLLDFTDEIIKQKPDVVIIYAGHNEYYGALGVGSTSYVGSYPAIIRMYITAKNLRLFQLIENTYSKLISQNTKQVKKDITGMEAMVKQQRIPYNSKLFHAGINQFETNLEKILYKYKQNSIPVIISTLVCNEKNIKPFISDSIDTPRFIKQLNLNNKKTIELANSNANAAYLLGQHYLKINNDSAKKYLHKAKELDLLRFRAPEKINEVIELLSKKYNCHLINMKHIFQNYTNQCIIGNELLTEHVHPNIEGYFVMADAFYNKIKELNLIKGWENYITFNEAFNDIPITTIDSICGKMIIDNLKKSWPFDLKRAGNRYEKKYSFRDNTSFEQHKAIELFKNNTPRDQVMLQAYKWYKKNKNYEQCLRIIQSDILTNPDWTNLYLYAGDICLKLNDIKKAIFYFSKYNHLTKNSFSAQQLATVLLKANQTEKARQILIEANKRGINDTTINKMLNKMNQSE